MNPLAKAIEELLPTKLSDTYWCFLLIRMALVSSNLLVAFLVPFFGKWNKHGSCTSIVHVSSNLTSLHCRNYNVSNGFPLQCSYGNNLLTSFYFAERMIVLLSRSSYILTVALIQAMVMPALCFLKILGKKNASTMQVRAQFSLSF